MKMIKKTQLTIGMAITFLLAVSGTYYLTQGDEAYYCNSRNMVMICEKLSSGIGTRCYYEEIYKVCKEGWEKIEIEQSLKQEEIINSKQIRCDQKECVPI